MTKWIFLRRTIFILLLILFTLKVLTSYYNPSYFATNPVIISKNLGDSKWRNMKYKWRREPSGRNDEYLPFSFLITNAEYKTFMLLLKNFVNLMEKIGLEKEYFVSGGSVLGSIRHHDMIPWDDDIDITFNVKFKQELLSAFEQYGGILDKRGRFVAREIYNRVKIFYEPKKDIFYRGKHRLDFSYVTVVENLKWPNLDVAFFDVGDSQIYETLIAYGRNYTYPIDVIKPTRKRPFGDLMVPMPNKPYQYVALSYEKLSLCSTHTYSHKFEGALGPKLIVACSNLNQTFAFNRYRLYRDAKDRVFVEEQLLFQGNQSSPIFINKFHTQLMEDESFVQDLII